MTAGSAAAGGGPVFKLCITTSRPEHRETFLEPAKRHATISLSKTDASNEDLLQGLVRNAFAGLTAPLGWVFLHSGAAARRGRAIVLVGRSMSGKSSLSLSLAERGFSLLSDETNVLRRAAGEFRVSGFPLKPEIREPAFGFFPALERSRPRLARTVAGKWILPGVRGIRRETKLGRLVFLEYSSSAAYRFRRLGPEELTSVFERCTGGYMSPDDHKDVMLDYLLALRLLCRQGLVYHCVYSDAERGRALASIVKGF